MKTVFALALILTGLAATPALADRPFGTSNQGPPTTAQTDARCPHHAAGCPMRHGR
jgi:hypothetical protein